MTKNRHKQVIARIMRMIWARPQTAEWLRQACVHRSWINETQSSRGEKELESNERLEFLGDSVLGLIISRELYERLPSQDEGRLSKAKARLVSARMLVEFAKELDLGSALLLGHGEETSGGRERESLLANALEAVLGAIFIAEGLSKTEAFVRELWKDEIEREISGLGSEDFKTMLQEFLQKRNGALPEYKVIRTIGPDHNRQYEITVAINGMIRGRGRGSSKKQAAQMAAAQAYHLLRNEKNTGGDL